MTQKVAREVAELEFERICVARRIDTDESEMDDDDKKSFAEIKRKVVRAIERGDLVVNESGDPIFTPPVAGAQALTFHRPTGATFMAMDSRGGNGKGGITATVAAITEMTRTAPGVVSKLEAPDFQFCCTLANLFLAQG
jgi:hypothetical protein